ncbi:hypothetical protein GE061_017202 [Apolygus lucorum]|uniref:Uncharacterized protein n=1 Tax=Apolygus lucorum TaxID=248454 RepID=A0A8S9XCI4_APOLU|nr:hypothetical protein GE061_017202 [Apolygus lucorum]
MREVTVLLTGFVLALAGASGPVYDQRQEGNTNVHAQLENVVVLLVPPQGLGLLDLVELASKSVGGGKQTAHETPYRAPQLDRHHVVDVHDHVVNAAVPQRVAAVHPLDDKLQRDPDYEQVKKHFSNLPALPVVTFADPSAPIQDSTAPPSDVAPSSSTSSTTKSSPEDTTPLVVKDAVTAHSPKLALYSQFRSAVQPSHLKKHNRASR